MGNSIQRFIIYDHFSKEAEFNIGGESKTKSGCGFFFTILLFFCTLLIFIQSALIMLNRKDPGVNIIENVVVDPPETSLSSLTLAFGIRTINGPVPLQHGYHYYIEATLTIYEMIPDDDTEGYAYQYYPLKIEPCTKEYFGDLYEEFSQIITNVSELFCMPRSQSYFSIRGKSGSPVYTTISV